MKGPIFEAFFLLTASTGFGKIIYIDTPMSWSDAQTYCRQKHTDLLAVTSMNERMTIQNATRAVTGKFWLGLYRDNPWDLVWKWSGGGEAHSIPWDEDQVVGEGSGSVDCWDCDWNGLRKHEQNHKHPFFCLDLSLIREKVPWEKALILCQQKGQTLVNLDSLVKHHLTNAELDQESFAEPVWVGLRFLDRWLWMNGVPPSNEGWSPASHDHLCPVRKRCGALTAGEKWENRDCAEKLSFICD